MASNLARRIAAIEDKLELSRVLSLAEIDARLAQRPGESDDDCLLRTIDLIGLEALLTSVDVEDPNELEKLYQYGIRQVRNRK